MKKRNIFIAIGIVFMLFSMACFVYVNSYAKGEKTFSFASTYKENQVTLKASIWESTDSDYAVLICPGYSCDRQKWKPFVNVFRAVNATVMTFDYAGQGASSGAIGFDNAKNDEIPTEIADAIEVLHQKTGVSYENIILVGHSMGGRSILRLLQDYNNPNAITSITKRNIKNVILMSPEVNYHENAQASLFAGTTDAEEEPWVSYNPDYITGTNLYLYGSTADDIVSYEDVMSTYAHVGGSNLPSQIPFIASCINENGDKLTIGITTGVLHSYEMYSPKFIAFVNDALKEITGVESSYGPARFKFVYAGWFAALAGIFLLLHGLNLAYKNVSLMDQVPSLTSEKTFLIRKLIMWIPGLLVAFIICCITVVMPFGSPVMNTPYMCFIAGYGLVMLVSYKNGSFKGTEGKLPKPTLVFKGNAKEGIITVMVTALVCFFAWFILRSSMYRLMPVNMRLFWLIFAIVLMSIGYYISGVESDMLKRENASAKTRILYSLIQYVPLFLFVLFYLIIKSYSGLIGQILNVFLMYILCIPIGDYLRNRTRNRLIGAIVTACLFQMLMITSAALIAMF